MHRRRGDENGEKNWRTLAGEEEWRAGEEEWRAGEEEWKAGERERRSREQVLLQKVAVDSLFYTSFS